MKKLVLLLIFTSILTSCASMGPNGVYWKDKDRYYRYHAEKLCKNLGGVCGIGYNSDDYYIWVHCQTGEPFLFPKLEEG